MNSLFGTKPLKERACFSLKTRNKKPWHTVAIWTFTFHKISGLVRVILKANFKQSTGRDYNFFSAEVKNKRVILRIVLTTSYKSALQIWLC